MRRLFLRHLIPIVLLTMSCANPAASSSATPQMTQTATWQPPRQSTTALPSPMSRQTEELVDDPHGIIRPTLTATSQPTATLNPTPLSWDLLAPGIEATFVPVNLPGGTATSYAYVVRIDPSRVTFRIHYDPEQPRLMEEWQAATGAGVVVNAGFFAGNNTPVGRIVTEGREYGYPLNYGEETIGVAGVFGVVDGAVDLYAIGRSSFSPRGLRFDEAVESYPMLVLPGNQPVYPTETGEAARRTVIGLDSQHRVIILVCDVPIFTLHQLADWLASSDLQVDSALNLDGGRSSGLMVWLRGGNKLIPSYVPVPIIIAVYPN